MPFDSDHRNATFTRRRALQLGGLLGLTGVAAACGTDDAGGPATSAPPTTPTPTSSSVASVPSSSSESALPSVTTSSSTSAPAGAFVLDDAAMADLDAIFTEQFTKSGIAGMAAKVWVGGKTWEKVSGVKDLESGAAFVPTETVRIASITKSFCATAVLQLVDAGSVKLDDVLETYVPGIANGEEITVELLLGMRSGIFDFTSDDKFLADFDADPTMAWSNADTVAVIKKHDPLFAPGEKVSYCDSNYVLLGMIVEKVTGRPAGEVINESLVAELDLPKTVYPADSSLPEPHPTGYVPTGPAATDPQATFDNKKYPPVVVNDVNPAVPATAGAMVSTLDDLAVWGRELAEGSLLKPETQALRLQGNRFDGVPINLGYGLGCEVLNDFIGHNGAVLGFSSVVMRYPAMDFTVAAVGNESTNFSTPTSTFVYAVIQKLFPDQWK
ncbi:serine hydrolase [Nakamurella sp. YIM 132087]|uniref:Serine hydrolase n=1 Tax=Nakamurella alba TaxID=2665158 RepID=A0A7K1FM16_9ACTN|nr:serine hydrolase domain-containing protein [Nakamurella alba]MTD15195.1 serine hydrolase [Nakamurella alba]